MKRFLEQKAQLEEHVKALHRVFLDFQHDSVYMTLEDLKQKLERSDKELRNRESDFARLQVQLTKARTANARTRGWSNGPRTGQ
jgi:hypothetical protein